MHDHPIPNPANHAMNDGRDHLSQGLPDPHDDRYDPPESALTSEPDDLDTYQYRQRSGPRNPPEL